MRTENNLQKSDTLCPLKHCSRSCYVYIIATTSLPTMAKEWMGLELQLKALHSRVRKECYSQWPSDVRAQYDYLAEVIGLPR